MTEAGAPPATPPNAPASPQTATRQWCLNCDTALQGDFCHRCGQRHTDFSVSLGVLARDFADEYLSFDSRLLRTLLALFFRPGFLTRQFLSGRRERYVRPLRLYIVASIVFFFAMSFLVHPDFEFGESRDVTFRELLVEQSDAAAGGGVTEEVPWQSTLGVDTIRIGGWSYSVSDRLERLSGMTPRQLVDGLAAGVERYLPRMMFLMLPVFALILKLLYVRRRWYFAEHFVFSLHFHAFAFTVLLAIIALPDSVLTTLLAFWLFVYLGIALHRTYRQPVWKTTIKFGLLTGIYIMLLGIGMVVSLVVAALVV